MHSLEGFILWFPPDNVAIRHFRDGSICRSRCHDLQAQINAAQPGTTIEIPPGTVRTGNYSLPAKSGKQRLDCHPHGRCRLGPAMTPGQPLAHILSPNASSDRHQAIRAQLQAGMPEHRRGGHSGSHSNLEATEWENSNHHGRTTKQGKTMQIAIRTITFSLYVTVLILAQPIAIHAQPYIYVANVYGDNVSVIDAKKQVVIADVPVPSGGPGGVAVSPDGSVIYVTSENNNNVSVIKASSPYTHIKTIPTGNLPTAVAFTPDGSRVFVRNSMSHTVTVINTATEAPVATVRVGSKPSALAFAPNKKLVFVANQLSGNVTVMSTGTHAVVNTFAAQSGPSALVVSPGEQYVYVANCYSNTVTVHSTSGHLLATVHGFTYPNGLAVSPTHNRLFVSNGNGGSLSIIDMSSNKLIATVPSGSLPSAVAVSPDGSRVYVANEFDFSLSQFAAGTNVLLHTLRSVGIYPVALAVRP
jgi:YVTN family beta-propeller protein